MVMVMFLDGGRIIISFRGALIEGGGRLMEIDEGTEIEG